VKLPRLVRTASFRLAALYVLMFVSSVGPLGIVVFWTTRAAIEAQVADRIQSETRYLRGVWETEGLGALRALVQQRDSGISALDYALRDPRGVRLAGKLSPMLGNVGWNHLRIPNADERGAEPELLLVTMLPDGSRLSVGDDLGRVTQAGRVIGRVFALAIIAIVMLGIAGGVLISRAFLRRVDAIARTAEAIIGGNLKRRVPVENTFDDLDRLAVTLNRMLDRNETLLTSLQHLGSNVAHDLRTPLSQLRQTLEEARRTDTTVDGFRASIDLAIARAQSMQQIFAALLRIAQLEGGSGGAPFEALDLSDVLDTVADAYVPLAEQDGYVVQLESDIDSWVDGDRQLLMQMLANLIENALQHTPPGTRIRASVLRRPPRGVQLQVADNGPGVPAADRGRITERFYRCERSRTTPGHGLGLSLVAAIADLHNASLSIEDAAPGLRFRITFPAAARPKPRPAVAQAAVGLEPR
jgi:signal transduction histidine kinase